MQQRGFQDAAQQVLQVPQHGEVVYRLPPLSQLFWERGGRTEWQKMIQNFSRVTSMGPTSSATALSFLDPGLLSILSPELYSQPTFWSFQRIDFRSQRNFKIPRNQSTFACLFWTEAFLSSAKKSIMYSSTPVTAPPQTNRKTAHAWIWKLSPDLFQVILSSERLFPCFTTAAQMLTKLSETPCYLPCQSTVSPKPVDSSDRFKMVRIEKHPKKCGLHFRRNTFNYVGVITESVRTRGVTALTVSYDRCSQRPRNSTHRGRLWVTSQTVRVEIPLTIEGIISLLMAFTEKERIRQWKYGDEN